MIIADTMRKQKTEFIFRYTETIMDRHNQDSSYAPGVRLILFHRALSTLALSLASISPPRYSYHCLVPFRYVMLPLIINGGN